MTNTLSKKFQFGLTIKQSSRHPSFYQLIRNIPHYGPQFIGTAMMDDFGYLAKVDFTKLAIIFRD